MANEEKVPPVRARILPKSGRAPHGPYVNSQGNVYVLQKRARGG